MVNFILLTSIIIFFNSCPYWFEVFFKCQLNDMRTIEIIGYSLMFRKSRIKEKQDEKLIFTPPDLDQRSRNLIYLPLSGWAHVSVERFCWRTLAHLKVIFSLGFIDPEASEHTQSGGPWQHRALSEVDPDSSDPVCVQEDEQVSRCLEPQRPKRVLGSWTLWLKCITWCKHSKTNLWVKLPQFEEIV